jgi:hypothetical protein
MRGRSRWFLTLTLAVACSDAPPGDAWPLEDVPNRCDPGQRILLDDVTNARDLGGVPLASGNNTACDVVFRGPPLASASNALCSHAAALGVRTVIDLRTAEERSAVPDADCILAGAHVVSAPMPIPYTVSAADYIADLNAAESVATAFRAFGDDSAYPVYFHCTWGRDRTGVLAAIVLAALGAPRQAILSEYALSRYTVGAYPESLSAVLDEIERRGGIEAYLRDAGVSGEELSVLRRHLGGGEAP